MKKFWIPKKILGYWKTSLVNMAGTGGQCQIVLIWNDTFSIHNSFKAKHLNPTMYEAGLIYSIVAGFMSVVLMLYSIEKKDEHFFVFSLMFLIISWSGIEWALWLQGYNLFQLVLTPIVPLASYFVGWTLFVIFVSEKYFKRRYWIAFLIVMGFFIWISTFCMNCLAD